MPQPSQPISNQCRAKAIGEKQWQVCETRSLFGHCLHCILENYIMGILMTAQSSCSCNASKISHSFAGTLLKKHGSCDNLMQSQVRNQYSISKHQSLNRYNALYWRSQRQAIHLKYRSWIKGRDPYWRGGMTWNRLRENTALWLNPGRRNASPPEQRLATQMGSSSTSWGQRIAETGALVRCCWHWAAGWSRDLQHETSLHCLLKRTIPPQSASAPVHHGSLAW